MHFRPGLFPTSNCSHRFLLFSQPLYRSGLRNWILQFIRFPLLCSEHSVQCDHSTLDFPDRDFILQCFYKPLCDVPWTHGQWPTAKPRCEQSGTTSPPAPRSSSSHRAHDSWLPATLYRSTHCDLHWSSCERPHPWRTWSAGRFQSSIPFRWTKRPPRSTSSTCAKHDAPGIWSWFHVSTHGRRKPLPRPSPCGHYFSGNASSCGSWAIWTATIRTCCGPAICFTIGPGLWVTCTEVLLLFNAKFAFPCGAFQLRCY